MLLLLKCLKVSLEVILDHGGKNSSGCFAWSWEVSVPKKVSGKTRGEHREVERGKAALPEPALCVATKKSFGRGRNFHVRREEIGARQARVLRSIHCQQGEDAAAAAAAAHRACS